MKATLSFRKDFVEKAFRNARHAMPVLSVMRTRRKMLLMSILISHIFIQSAFSQKTTTFLSKYDSCHVHVPAQAPLAIEAVSAGAPRVRVAYVIPSNRSPQSNGVADLQNAISAGQQFYKDQMEQNGFGAKTYSYETEADGVTPMVHVVHVNETDEFLRGDIWGRTIQAAINAGISVWTSGEVWVLIPETHLMLPDGTVTGGAALGGSFGSGNSPGVAMLGSNALPFLPLLKDDTPYNGQVLPALGSFPMKQDVSAPWFEGTTFSSIASSQLGALWHEMGHAFGLPHDFRNDNNFHGNLMGNGLRGVRGALFPEKYSQDYTRLEYASGLILNGSHYFNTNKIAAASPVVFYANPGSITPKQGLVNIAFQAFDEDSLSLAHLRYRGDAVAEMILKNTKTDTAFAVPYFAQGDYNSYTIVVYDKQGNLTYMDLQVTVPAGYNQAPVPFIQIDPPVPGPNQPVTLNAAGSFDYNHDQSSLLASWDVDNDGRFDTEPSTNKMMQYLYSNGGNYLIRLKLTDPEGAQTISTPVSIRIPGEKKIAVETFTLIDAGKDEARSDLRPGMVIDLAAWQGKTFSIRANTSPGTIDRVEFDLKGPVTHQQTERILPYALFGDNPQGNFNGRKLLPGDYTLTATPFSSSGKGIALTVSFRVRESLPGEPAILWDKTIGGTGNDYLGSTIVTSDGGYLLAGHSDSDASADKSENSRGGNDFWVVKLDAGHNKQWDKTFGGSNDDQLKRVIAAPDGGYLLAGYSQSNASGDKSENRKGFYDFWVVKIDSQGNKLWDKTYGGSRSELLYTVVSVSTGGYLLAGFSESSISGDKSENNKGRVDYWVVRIDDLGNKIWDRTFGGIREDELRSVTPTSDGGYLLGGYSRSDISGDKSENSRGSTDYWVLKIDEQGNKVWDKTLGGVNDDLLNCTIPAADGGFLLVGYSDSDISGDKSESGKGSYDSWVVKLDAAGNKMWDKTFGGDVVDVTTSAVPAPDGGYFLAGYSNSNTSGDKSDDSRGKEDYWAIKIDNAGNRIWDKTMGGSSIEFRTSATFTSDGSYLLSGQSNSDASGDKSENRKGGCDQNGNCTYDYWIVALKEPGTPAVMNLTLMNADTDREIQELNDGDVIRLTDVGCRLLNIRANITDENIKKVSFRLKGPVSHYQTERIAPYELFGDQGGKLPAGEYTLTVTPYVNSTKGHDLTISFSVTDGFAISGFSLIDATSDRKAGELTEGDVIDLSILKGHKLTVLVDTQPAHIEKVDLTLQGPVTYSTTERYFPYTLFGDFTKDGCSTDYAGRNFVPGTYTLTASPYSGGVKGTPYTITFTVISGGTAGGECRKVEVYPLPARGFINIAHEGETENTHLFLLDFNGNVLLNRPLSQQPVEQLDVSVYRKGIHYLKVVGPEEVQIIRLVIE